MIVLLTPDEAKAIQDIPQAQIVAVVREDLGCWEVIKDVEGPTPYRVPSIDAMLYKGKHQEQHPSITFVEVGDRVEIHLNFDPKAHGTSVAHNMAALSAGYLMGQFPGSYMVTPVGTIQSPSRKTLNEPEQPD